MKVIESKIYFFFAILVGILAISCGKSDKEFATRRGEGLRAFESGDYYKAVNLFKEAYLIKPSDRDILYDLGRTFKKLSLYDSALVYFKRGKILYSADRPINKEILDLSIGANDTKGALLAIATLIATGDNERMYWPLLAELNYREKNYTLAVHYYQLLLKENPQEPNNYLLLSGVLSQTGQFEESNGILALAIQSFGPNPEFYTNIAINCINMKNFAKAEEYMRLSLQLNPNSIPIWINLANLLGEQNDKAKKKEALGIYKKYRKGAPQGFKIDSLIGVLENELK